MIQRCVLNSLHLTDNGWFDFFNDYSDTRQWLQLMARKEHPDAEPTAERLRVAYVAWRKQQTPLGKFLQNAKKV